MRKLLLFISTLIFSTAISQNIPASHHNLGQDDKGLFVKKNDRKIYFQQPNENFIFEDFYGNPKGDKNGFALDFNQRHLNGTLYFGFINYNDGSYPQPVYFKRYATIKEGKAFIDINKYFRGKYDMVDWTKTGIGTLGYRIIREDGQFLYDGKLSFKYSTTDSLFHYVPTLIEGPFVDQVKPNSAIVSFTLTKPEKASVSINEEIFRSAEADYHEIMVHGLDSNRAYEYTVNLPDRSFTYTLKTAPENGSKVPFTFAYSSDSRAGKGGGERDIYGANAYIIKRIGALAKAEDIAFLQFSGDLINGYDAGRNRQQLQYANWKHAIEPFAHHMPIYEAFGNHEAFGFRAYDKEDRQGFMIDKFPYETQSAEKLFRDNFVNPISDLKSEDHSKYDPSAETDFPSYDETVFWYQYANVAVVVLNSNYWYAPDGLQHTGGNIHAYIMDNQLDWFKKTMKELEKNRTIDHIFITLHTPFFPNGGHVDDDMWYGGNNDPRPVINGKPVDKGIIERRDQLLDIIVNKSKKAVALMTGDEHNYNLMTIVDNMDRWPTDYPHKKVKLTRKFYQINNGAAGAPYYAQEQTPWSQQVSGFSTQNALVLIDVEGTSVKVRVKNPDTLEEITSYTLR